MGKSLVGKIIYFWIFLLAGLFFSKIFGVIRDNKDFIVVMIVLALFYWGFAFIKASFDKRRKSK